MNEYEITPWHPLIRLRAILVLSLLCVGLLHYLLLIAALLLWLFSSLGLVNQTMTELSLLLLSSRDEARVASRASLLVLAFRFVSCFSGGPGVPVLLLLGAIYLFAEVSIRLQDGLAGVRADPWQDEQVFQRNRLQCHVPLLYHQDHASAVARCPASSPAASDAPTRQSLNGAWRFLLSPNPAAAPGDFMRPAYQETRQWTSMAVPGNWEMEGHGTLRYTNITYPIPTAMPATPADNPTACYRRRFDVAEAWLQQGRRVHLVFHGCESALQLWVNGVEVGYSQGNRLPAEFDVTPYVRACDNTVAVKVVRWSDGTFLEDQDHWYASGLHRDVELLSLPAVRVADYSVHTHLEGLDGAASEVRAELQVTVTAATALVITTPMTVCMQLFGQDGALVVEQEAVVVPNSWSADGNGGDADNDAGNRGEHAVLQQSTCSLRASVAAPRLWSAEQPHLYKLVLGLKSESGQSVWESSEVGFRRLEIVQGQLLVNGQAVLIKGVNRHEHDERKGKVVSEESMLHDLLLMKQLNFNAVRCSHYPNHSRLYELCDRLGLYVCDEANIETHGQTPSMGRLACDPAWSRAWVNRTKRMVQRDKNHACIILWSLGNESGYGLNHRLAKRAILALDTTRPVQYEGGSSRTRNFMQIGDGTSPVTDIICPMYATVKEVLALGTNPKDVRPVILCEYSHAMGNSNGNLHEYYAAFESERRLQGGFIWDWVDQGFVVATRPAFQPEDETVEPVLRAARKLAQKLPTDIHYGYGGNFNDTDNKDAQFCLNGLLWPNRVPKPACWEAKYLQQPVRVAWAADSLQVAEVLNKNFFVDLDDVTFEWQEVCADGSVLSTGSFACPGLGPRQTARVPLEGLQGAGAWVDVRAVLPEGAPWAPKQHVLAKCQLLLQGLPGGAAPPGPARPHTTPLAVEQGGDHVEVTCGEVALRFSKSTGDLDSFRQGGRELLQLPVGGAGLRHCFYRACTDNDVGGSDYAAEMNPLLPPAVIKGLIRFLPMLSNKWQWRKAALDRLQPYNVSVRATTEAEAEVIKVFVSQELSADDLSPALFKVSTLFTVRRDAQVTMDVKVTVLGAAALVRSLGRVGFHLPLCSTLNQTKWLGRGPHENYSDRKAGALLGVYELPVADHYVPYTFPGENGGKADVQWMQVTDPAGFGLMVSTEDSQVPLHVSVLPVGLTALDQAKNSALVDPHALLPPSTPANSVVPAPVEAQPDADSPPVHLHIDHQHMGVGGDVSWLPSVLEPYLLDKTKEYSYRVCLRAIS